MDKKIVMTSIEWLEKELKKSIHFYRLIEDLESKSTILEDDVFQQAKERHKQEILDAWHNGYNNQSPMIDEENCGEQYYEKTFK